MIFQKAHFILVVGDGFATLIHQKGKETLSLWRLTKPSDLREFVKPALNLNILINISEQKTHQEQCPKLSYFDQKCWLRQLVKNSYEKGHVFGLFSFEKFPTPITMMTIERTAYLETWLVMLKSLKVQILGVYSLPVEAVKLIRPNLALKTWVLLITRHGLNGARHAIFYNQRLVFTRLISLKTEQDHFEDLAREIEEGITASLAYLQRLPQAGKSPVHLLYFDQPEVLNYLPKTRPDITACDYRGLKADHIKFACPPDCLADLLHAQAFMDDNRHVLRLKLAGFSKLLVIFPILYRKYAAPLSALCSGLALAFALNYNKLLPVKVKLVPLESYSKKSPSEPKSAPLLKDLSHLKNAPYLHLKAVIYSNPRQWTLWLNDRCMTPLMLDPDLIIHQVTANQIICTWHQETHVWKNIVLKLNTRFYIKGTDVVKSGPRQPD
jgi:hypothetical protein